MPTTPISIMVVEDHQITRTGLKLMLQLHEDFKIVGDAEDGLTAVSKALDLRPEVILMDIGLPKVDGIEATWQIKSAQPECRIIMLTSQDRDEDILAALGVGADGYCFKDVSIEALVEGIRTVKGGASWLDPRVKQRMTRARAKETKSSTADPIHVLSKRELEILTLLEEGFDSDQIATQKSLHVEVVDMYKRVIMQKLFHTEPGDEIVRKTENWVTTSSPRCEPSELQPERHSPRQAPNLVAPELTVGSIFADRYIIESLIGKGGIGLVYRAKHMHMERTVAIKVLQSALLSDRKLLKSFHDESRAASSLSHPNIVTMYDFGLSSQGQPFLVMDFLDGQSLDDVLKIEESLSVERFLRVFIQVCDGLIAAHSRNLVHCDLKPSNIMLVTDDCGQELAKIVDFGLAVVIPKDSESQLTDRFEIYGSPCYMSPEQCSGSKLDVRSDIYSLGCVMYEAITGDNVFHAVNPLEMFSKQITETPRRFSEVCPEKSIPGVIEKVIFKALAKKASDRFQSMVNLRELLMVAGQLVHLH